MFLGLRALEGSGTAALRKWGLGYFAPQDRAYRLAKKADDVDSSVFIDEQLQQIGVDAVNRLGELVNSTDENIASRNVHYTIDHIRGQATKKTVTLHGRINVQTAID